MKKNSIHFILLQFFLLKILIHIHVYMYVYTHKYIYKIRERLRTPIHINRHTQITA